MQATKSTRISIFLHQFRRRWAMNKLAMMPETWEPNLNNAMRISLWRARK